MLKVLLIEDDPIVQLVHKKLLEKNYCQVETAADGKTALAKADNSFDIIFSDIGLPDINGFEVMEQISNDHSINQPSLIALTAFSSDEERERSFASGAEWVLIKPVSEEELVRVLNNIRDKKSSETLLAKA